METELAFWFCAAEKNILSGEDTNGLSYELLTDQSKYLLLIYISSWVTGYIFTEELLYCFEVVTVIEVVGERGGGVGRGGRRERD